MPNWAYNRVTVYSQDVELLEAVIKAVESKDPASGKALSFESVLPLGEWEHEKAIEVWGTKWDVNEFTLERPGPHLAVYEFDTAWSPPLPVLDALSRQHPGVVLHLAGSEESWAYLISFWWSNGSRVLELDEDPSEYARCENCGEKDSSQCEEGHPEWDYECEKVLDTDGEEASWFRFDEAIAREMSVSPRV